MATLPDYVTREGGQYLAERIKEKAPIASPAFTGTPTAPTAAAGTDTTQIATTAFVKKAVDDALEGIYTPKGSVDTAADLPTDAEPGDIWTVNGETVVTEDGSGKNVVEDVTGTVDTYDDLLALDPQPAADTIYKVKTGDDGTGTYGEAYDDNSYFKYDGTDWKLMGGATGQDAKTDYKYTEEDGWTPMEGGVDLSNLVTKDELAEADYVKHEELKAVPLADVIAWFADATYTAVTPTGTENPKQEGWYEKVGDNYELTEDETVDSGKTYYTKD